MSESPVGRASRLRGVEARARTSGGWAVVQVPPFRRYLLSMLVFSIGLWTFQTSVAWTLLLEVGSPSIVSALFVAWLVPVPFASIVAGVLVDRFGPRRVLVAGLLGIATAAGTAGVLATMGALTAPIALVLFVVLGVSDGHGVVAAQLILGRIVKPGLLGPALGIGSLPAGVGRLVGGPVGGAILQVAGPAVAPLVGAIVIGASALIAATMPPLPGLDPAIGLSLRDLRSAGADLRRRSGLPGLVAVGAVAAGCLFGYIALLPAVARDLVGGGPTALGVLTAAGGLGSLIAAIAVSPLARRVGEGRFVVVTAGVVGVGLVVLPVLSGIWAVSIVVALVSAGTTAYGVVAVHLLQAFADPRLRGRTLAIHSFAFFGAHVAGLLVTGALADRIGVAGALGLAGMLALGGVMLIVARSPVGRLTVGAPDTPAGSA